MLDVVDAKAKRLTKKVEKKKQQKRVGFLQQVKDELKKVTWTSKKELFLCTKIVVGVTVVFGMGIYVADLGIKGALGLIGSFVRLILG